jgi:hypothetical protein
MGIASWYFRSAILAATATLALVVPATAGANTSISVSIGHLLAQGTEVPMQVDVTCDPGFDFAFVEASLTQVSGHKLAQGSGAFFSPGNPGTPCASSPISTTFTIGANGAFTFKEGDATASFDVVLVDPTTDNFFDNNFTQTTRLTKK